MIKKSIYFLLSAVVVLFGLTFAFQNKHYIDVSYYFGMQWNAPLALVLFWAFVSGIVIGIVVAFFKVLRLQGQLNKARKEVRQAEQEVANLRSLPIKDVV